MEISSPSEIQLMIAPFFFFLKAVWVINLERLIFIPRKWKKMSTDRQ